MSKKEKVIYEMEIKIKEATKQYEDKTLLE